MSQHNKIQHHFMCKTGGSMAKNVKLCKYKLNMHGHIQISTTAVDGRSP